MYVFQNITSRKVGNHYVLDGQPTMKKKHTHIYPHDYDSLFLRLFLFPTRQLNRY